MVDGSPGNPTPLPEEPWLEALTFEQIARLVNEVSPEVFYLRASAFDQAGARLQDVLDQIRHEMNHVREVWTGTASDDFDALVRNVTGKVGAVLPFLQNPGYGATLRDAGDRLADHQRRLRDLAGQKAQQESTPPAPGAPPPETIARVNNDSAKQILRDLRTAYWDIGNALPGFPYKPPTKEVGDPDTVTSDNGGNTNGRNNQHQNNGQHDPALNGGESPPGSWFGDHANAPPNIVGPAGLPGPPVVNMFSMSRPGPHEGQFGGQDGPGGHGEQVLGRADPGGQSWTDPGGHGWPEPDGPAGQPGPMFFAGTVTEHGPAVLGHPSVVARMPDPCPGQEDGHAPLTGGLPPVLGRSEIGRPGGVGMPGRTTDAQRSERRKVEEPRKRKVVEEPEELVENRQETVSGEILHAPTEPGPVTIRTTVDAPLPDGQEREVAAVPAQLSVTTQGVPAASVPPTDPPPPDPTPPAPARKSDVEPRPPLALPVSHGSGGGTPAVAFDPETRGMFAPGAMSTDGLPVQVTGAGASPAPSGQPVRTDPYGSQPGGGFPMSPMMMGGGMGGGMGQQSSRMADMPNEPRPESWDPVTDAPVVLGRREPAEPDQRDSRYAQEPGLTKEEVQARIAEKFTELDRLTERRNNGGK